MKQSRICLFVFCLFFMIVQSGHAQVGLKKVGQSTMNFLQVNVSPRAAALGETYIAVGQGAEGIFFNPAGAAEFSGRFDVKIYVTRWIADINYMAGAVVYHLGHLGSVGVSALWVDYGTVYGTSLISSSDIAQYPLGYRDNGEMNNVGAYALGITFARAVSQRFYIGGNVRLAGQNLGENMITGGTVTQNTAGKLVFDAGVKYYTGVKSFCFGMAIRNFSSNLKREEISEPLPILFAMGAAVDILELVAPEYSEKNRLLLAVDFLHPNNYTERLNVGLEYTVWNMLSLRGGYQTNHDIASWSAGIGTRSRIGTNDITFDYSYSDLDIFSNVNRFSVGIAF